MPVTVQYYFLNEDPGMMSETDTFSSWISDISSMIAQILIFIACNNMPIAICL